MKLSVPREDEDWRFVQSFDSADADGLKAFFQQYGFVVVRDVLSSAQCRATIDEIWRSLEIGPWSPTRHQSNPLASTLSSGASGRVNRLDPKTWDPSNWPNSSRPKYGLAVRQSSFAPALLDNRQSPQVHAAFAAIYGTPDLLCNHDRIGLMLPTAMPGVGGSHWKTPESLHLDTNPLEFYENTGVHQRVLQLDYSDPQSFVSENNMLSHSSINGGFNLQAILNLMDNAEEDGGLQLVPGFCHIFQQYVASLQSYKVARQAKMAPTTAATPGLIWEIDARDPLQKQAVRIPSRAGSLIIWDSRTAHGSAPNKSGRFRFVQFLKMFPRSNLQDESGKLPKSRALAVRAAVDKAAAFSEFVLSEHGARVFGLDR